MDMQYIFPEARRVRAIVPTTNKSTIKATFPYKTEEEYKEAIALAIEQRDVMGVEEWGEECWNIIMENPHILKGRAQVPRPSVERNQSVKHAEHYCLRMKTCLGSKAIAFLCTEEALTKAYAEMMDWYKDCCREKLLLLMKRVNITEEDVSSEIPDDFKEFAMEKITQQTKGGFHDWLKKNK